MALEKKVSYTTSNTYCTANNLGPKTKNVWLVFHGMGYLSRYFINYFSELDEEENFIIAPQAPSKYYLGTKFKHVGATWLTRENTVEETVNVLNYVDAVFASEKPEKLPNFIILGYSQGVSIALRWMASRKIQCDQLVIHSGGIPKELNKEDFNYLSETTNVTYLFGNKDEYITEARKTEETLKGSGLFGKKLKTVEFEGVHEVNKAYLKQLSKEK